MSKDQIDSKMQLVLFWFVIVWSVQDTSAFTRFSIPTAFTTDEWATANNDLKTCLGPLHHDLSSESITPQSAGDQFNNVVCDFLSKYLEFLEDREIDTYYRNTPQTIDQARKAKNYLRKKA